MSFNPVRLFLYVMTLTLAFSFPSDAHADPTSEVLTIWRLLDYISVDYAGAVTKGEVTNEIEYTEQKEFSSTVRTRIGLLPANPARAELQAAAERLQSAIAEKAESAGVAIIARRLAASLLGAYPVPIAPVKPPSFARGQALFKDNCASCHGASGDGHGPDAAKLDSPPIAFTDQVRARGRSIFALYQVVTQGVDGTPMRGFDEFDSQDRWALADYAGHFAFSGDAAAEGKHLWTSDPAIRRLIPDLKSLVTLTPQALASEIGQEKADALIAYLRRNPAVVVTQASESLALVRERMKASLEASRAGDRKNAGDLALSAYLDGFEPIEPTLGAQDPTLMGRIEGLMIEYRAAVQREGPDQLATRQLILDGLYDDAENAMAASTGRFVPTFLGAATILLREGLEALLIIVAMIAFLRKSDRGELMRYVHAGWIGALIAGFGTWAVATWAIDISGASRELTEGFGSVFAAAVLLSVGIWMHGKAQADQWQHYIRAKMAGAMSGHSAWLLFGLAFVVVYREVFETILFYAAMTAQGNGIAMLGGAVSASAGLAVIAWAMLRYSRRLPVGRFFSYSSWLMAILTVVLAGKGVSALQEAGIVGIAPLTEIPRVELIGLFPTIQTVAAQALILAALFVGFARNRRRASLRLAGE